jgi:CheY-like chemotaxis protein
VAIILVADDNSNVQKTVALALVGLGVNVISVNNGEAAVRKLADIKPDLVLADIFMPVRNGYEVCEFVKKDIRFANVPVVLLVGAFDPLDEREAQRVGADGILKKPFVPPDPLITMVKTLLERTMGERMVAVSAAKPAVAVAGRSSRTAIAQQDPPPPDASDTSEESPTHGSSISAGRVSFGGGEHPVAFSQLLATPEQDPVAPATDVIEPVDNDQVLTSSRDATLGDPIFWRNDAPEPENSESEQGSENPEDFTEDLELRTWNQGEDSLPRREDSLHLPPIEPLELVRDDQGESPQTVVDSKSILLDQAAQAPLHVDSGTAPELAANPIEWMATAPAEHAGESVEETPAWDDAIPETAETFGSVELTGRPHIEAPASWPLPEKSSAPVPSSVEDPTGDAVDSPAGVFAAPPVVSPTSSPFSVSFSPASSSPDVSARPEERHEETPLEHTRALQPPPSLSQSVLETTPSMSKQDWTELTAELDSRTTILEPLKDMQRIKPESLLAALQSRIGEVKKEPTNSASAPVVIQTAAHRAESAQGHIEPPSAPAASLPAAPLPAAPSGSSLSTVENPAPGPTPDPVLVEAVVQRVLDKMRPQVVDIITKEFLRPIVQALVHREIEKH